MKKYRNYSLLLILSMGCASIRTNSKQIIHWNSVGFPVDLATWQVVKTTTNKVTLESIAYEGKERPGIYLEYAQIPKNKKLTITSLLSKTIQAYKALYDDVKYDKIRIDDVTCYSIKHNIESEKKRLQTTIIPTGRGYIFAVIYANEQDFSRVKKTYDEILVAIANGLSRDEKHTKTAPSWLKERNESLETR